MKISSSSLSMSCSCVALLALIQCITAFAPQRPFVSVSVSVPAVNTITSSRSESRSLSLLEMASESSIADGGAVPTLTEDTTWRLRFSLNSVPTSKGKKVGELFVVDVQFIEEEGYEPPQGKIVQIKTNQKENVNYLNVNNGRWKLSEDPNDRKDGLWVWGLFREPLYPFMLLQIDTEAYPLPLPGGAGAGADDDDTSAADADSIQPLTLYAQINHKRDRDTGRVELEAASLNIREVESLKADPFGAARVDVFEDVKVGQLSLRPLVENGVNNAVL